VTENYPAWGSSHRGDNWTGGPTSQELTAMGNVTRRGFTGQEMLDNLWEVDMNGRTMAGPHFLTPDVRIPDPTDTRSYDRYAYVNYNPLTSTDPTGFDDCPGGAMCAFPTSGGDIDVPMPQINFPPPDAGRPPQEFFDPSATIYFGNGVTLYGGMMTQTYTPENRIDGQTGELISQHYGYDYFAGPPSWSNLVGRFNPDTGMYSSALSGESWFSPSLTAELGTDALKFSLGFQASVQGTLNYTATRALPIAAGLAAGPLLLGGAAATEGAVATEETVTVIGRMKNLENLAPGERSLLDRLTPDLGSAKANWARNSGVLRQEMRRGLPIRDASPGDTAGTFLNAERALLRERGWTFDPSTNFWMPPP